MPKLGIAEYSSFRGVNVETVGYLTAFAGGLISFITPCVLPLVPVYLSILSGTSFDELTGRAGELSADKRGEIHRRVLANAVAFIFGFSFVFILSGVLAGILGEGIIGNFTTRWGDLLLRLIGVIVIILGLNMAGIWKPAFLSTEARFQIQKGKFGLISSGVIGAAFAFGWAPCIGPILAPILALAAGTGSKIEGALLLATYSFGLAIPFFLSALSVNGLIAFTNKMKRHFHTMELIIGAILILIGLFLAILGTGGPERLRGELSWLDRITSRIEMSIIGESEEEESGPVVMDEEGAIVYVDEESTDDEIPNVESFEPDVGDSSEEDVPEEPDNGA